MENNNNQTIYHKLVSFFATDNNFTNVQPLQQPETQQKVIIKGNSPEDVQRKGLELQQKQDLLSKFYKTTDRSYQKALQYESARLPAYLDYEGMEYFPLISSALDLFMEEATTIGNNGKMLNVYSNNERIKTALEELFYTTINVNVNLPFWIRNMPIKHDSIIPLLDGTEITIQELSKKLKNNPEEEIWTYSVQDNTHNIVPGKIIWCDLTRKESEIYKITFDDNTYIETSPDHEFILRNGDKLRADSLYPGLSLMPFYTLITKEGEMVYNPSTNEHIFTNSINFIDFFKNEVLSDNVDTQALKNHKVLSIEKLEAKSDVYCMEVVGKNNEQDRHNFPVCSKNADGTYTRNGVFVSNCKYGDNFVLMFGERKKGVTHVKQMVNYEVERRELVENGKPKTLFKERLTGDEFNIFEVAHFRLLGDDKYIPYGSSLLNKVRRVFRMLVMAEDAMVTYRLLRAGEKRVFKIDVGNMDEEDIEAYMYKVATKFKKSSQVNPTDGQIDYRFNILGNDEDYFLPLRNANSSTGIDTIQGACLSLDTEICLLDGRTLTLNEIISEYNNGNDLWVYSINPNTGEIIPSPITWAGITRKNTDVLKITLDNDEEIICTPDHKFPTKFNGIKEAKDLSIGESMWSFSLDPKDITIKNIEYLEDKIDTGTITVDGDEKYSNYHNFALKSGIFTKNSNLDAIHDIEYLRDNLFIGLGIPKPFLSFQDASGAGKNMAQFDVRFSKKVVRIQQAAIQELNKMAIVHLILLGFDEKDIRNFQLTLTNPSIQHDLLKSELLREQAQTYTELTRGENGIAAMSHTKAKRLVFNMSDAEIVEDLKQQKMEKVVMQELADAPVLIKKSGLFYDIDKKFGNETALIGASSGDTSQGGMPPSPMGGPGGEPPLGGPMGGGPGEMPSSPMGGPGGGSGGAGELPPISEQFNNYIHKLVGMEVPKVANTFKLTTDVILENNLINKKTFDLMKETEELIDNTGDIDIESIKID